MFFCLCLFLIFHLFNVFFFLKITNNIEKHDEVPATVSEYVQSCNFETVTENDKEIGIFEFNLRVRNEKTKTNKH